MGKERIILEDHAHLAIFGLDPLRATGDDAPINDNRTLIGALKPRDEPQQRRLAAAGGAKHRYEFPFLDIKCNRAQDKSPGKSLDHAF
jgi:hypothetical protein